MQKLATTYLPNAERKKRSMNKQWLTKILMAACMLVSTLISATASAGTVGILEPTVTGGMSSQEAQRAIAQGHTVTMISAAAWASMTEAQFSAYDALILGDPTCQVGDAAVSAAAANPAWAHAADGNVILIGSDPVFHYTYGGVYGAGVLMDRGIAFATAQQGTGRTGAYITLSCYYHFVS
ncbi:MAG TPA: hypothetical protein VL500_02740, partial [Candidatus Eisenbacteria bacterium]|nr:hypothetical protein [Candidatus Eisenbacteria bacterium]